MLKSWEITRAAAHFPVGYFTAPPTHHSASQEDDRQGSLCGERGTVMQARWAIRELGTVDPACRVPVLQRSPIESEDSDKIFWQVNDIVNPRLRVLVDVAACDDLQRAPGPLNPQRQVAMERADTRWIGSPVGLAD